MAKLQPGKYLAKIVDCDLFKSAKGNVSACLVMRAKDEAGNPTDMMWFGSFNGGAREITLRTLLNAGSKAASAQELAAELNRYQGEGMPLLAVPYDTSSDFEIVVENQPNPKNNNALEPRIAFINKPGGDSFRKRMTSGESAALLGGLNLGADLMSVRQKMGVTSAPAAAPAAVDEDIPF